MIPNMTSTEEAFAFGNQASREQVELMKRVRRVLENQFHNLLETDESDAAFALMGELATQAQLMREAFENSKY